MQSSNNNNENNSNSATTSEHVLSEHQETAALQSRSPSPDGSAPRRRKRTGSKKDYMLQRAAESEMMRSEESANLVTNEDEEEEESPMRPCKRARGADENAATVSPTTNDNQEEQQDGDAKRERLLFLLEVASDPKLSTMSSSNREDKNHHDFTFSGASSVCTSASSTPVPPPPPLAGGGGVPPSVIAMSPGVEDMEQDNDDKVSYALAFLSSHEDGVDRRMDAIEELKIRRRETVAASLASDLSCPRRQHRRRVSTGELPMLNYFPGAAADIKGLNSNTNPKADEDAARNESKLVPLSRPFGKREVEEKKAAAKASKSVSPSKSASSASNSRHVRKRTFPEKLLDVLSCPTSDVASKAIQWLPEGNGFVVSDPKLFVAKVLPQYFKQAKFESFTRKLNRWGFKRVVSKGAAAAAPANASVTYTHDLFRRGRPDLCKKMSGGRREMDDADDTNTVNSGMSVDKLKPSLSSKSLDEDDLDCGTHLKTTTTTMHLDNVQIVEEDRQSRKKKAHRRYNSDDSAVSAMAEVMGQDRIRSSAVSEDGHLSPLARPPSTCTMNSSSTPPPSMFTDMHRGAAPVTCNTIPTDSGYGRRGSSASTSSSRSMFEEHNKLSRAIEMAAARTNEARAKLAAIRGAVPSSASSTGSTCSASSAASSFASRASAAGNNELATASAKKSLALASRLLGQQQQQQQQRPVQATPAAQQMTASEALRMYYNHKIQEIASRYSESTPMQEHHQQQAVMANMASADFDVAALPRSVPDVSNLSYIDRLRLQLSTMKQKQSSVW